MTDRAELLQTQLSTILRLEAAIETGIPAVQEGLLPVLQSHRQEFWQLLNKSFGGPSQTIIGSHVETITGDTVNLATIQYIYQTIYGRDPTADERRRLEWYLQRLVNGAPTDTLVQQIYILVASSRTTPLFVGYSSQAEGYLELSGQQLVPSQNRHPDWVLPDMAVVTQPIEITDGKLEVTFQNAVTTVVPRPGDPAILLSRSLLLSEALADPVLAGTGVVLLGEPGSGKSTFLRHLSRVMAKRGLGQSGRDTQLPGWNPAQASVPVFLSIRQLATKLAVHRSEQASDVIFEAILQVLDNGIEGMRDVLNAAIGNGGMLLMFDGLDEIPPNDRGEVAGRRRVVQGLHTFVQRYPRNLAIVTCRTKVFTDDLRHDLGWRVEILAPFTLGQIRALVYAFFAAQSSSSTDEGNDRAAQGLLEAIVENNKLLSLARTPMLLRMMAEIALRGGDLPLNRPKLFETLIDRMLDGWEETKQKSSLASDYRINKDTLDSMRPIFNEQAYRAFADGSGSRENARILRDRLLTRLTDFFDEQVPALPANPAKACLDYLEQRADLVVRDPDDYYSFVHPTLQEYCAARHIAHDPDRAPQMIMQHRGSDYWREAILLATGLLSPLALDRVLNDLISSEEQAQPKLAYQWYRDLLLAADIAAERDWEVLQQEQLIRATSLRQGLGHGLERLLADIDEPLQPVDRVRAGYILADLGDRRYPVEGVAWKLALEQRGQCFGFTSNGAEHYLRFLPAGTYHDFEGRVLIETKPYWIASYPITVAQYAAFADVGYTSESNRWWTTSGLIWRAERRQPALWQDLIQRATNIPMIGATWFEATAFCGWLTAQVGDLLPEGYVFRLPTVSEWTAAASFDGSERPRTYPWGHLEPTPERAIYKATQITACAAVGCCPQGVAACGAQDLAGNVWEWADIVGAGDEVLRDSTELAPVAIMGGAWNSDADELRCSTQDMVSPNQSGLNVGFRIVLAAV